MAPRHDRVHVRPRNVILPAGCRATITGLVAAPEHNGVVGRVAWHDDDAGRYVIEIEEAGGQAAASTVRRLSVKRESALL